MFIPSAPSGTANTNSAPPSGVYSGIGGWAGIGMAAGLTESTAGLGAVGGYKDLAKYTTLGGTLFVFSLPDGDTTPR